MYQRVPQVLNMAVNSWLKNVLGELPGCPGGVGWGGGWQKGLEWGGEEAGGVLCIRECRRCSTWQSTADSRSSHTDPRGGGGATVCQRVHQVLNMAVNS